MTSTGYAHLTVVLILVVEEETGTVDTVLCICDGVICTASPARDDTNGCRDCIVCQGSIQGAGTVSSLEPVGLTCIEQAVHATLS